MTRLIKKSKFDLQLLNNEELLSLLDWMTNEDALSTTIRETMAVKITKELRARSLSSLQKAALANARNTLEFKDSVSGMLRESSLQN